MIFEYTGRHLVVTQALRSHAEDHFTRIAHALNGKASKAHIIIEVERGRHRSEVIVNWNGDILTAATTNSDMYQSLSQTIDKIEKQALKLKKKIIDKYHRAEKKNAVFQTGEQNSNANETPRIISEPQKRAKPITIEEAVINLEETANTFLVFRNAETERIAVIYKRTDGNYGLIEP